MTRKKKIALIISAVVIAVAVLCASAFVYASEVTKKNSIGLEKAINLALIDAGVPEENATVTKAKLDFEKGVFIYDIEFDSNGTDEYDYSVKASDGTILERNHELKDDDDFAKSKRTTAKAVTQSADVQPTQQQEITQAAPAAQNTTASQKATAKTTTAAAAEQTAKEPTQAVEKTSSASPSGISIEQAKDIAFNNSGVSKRDAQIISAYQDMDDGITYYDIEFKSGSYKYEYEIDLNGNVISYDKDRIAAKKPSAKKTTAVTADHSKYIGVDKAKEIALSNANVSAGNATFKKAKLERDDGVYEYEIEFIASDMEYEYEIHAVSGKIISRSSESVYDD